MQIADVYRRMGSMEHAKRYYVKVGEFYGDRGFLNKAVAAFKKALNITPDDHQILNKLAGYNDKVPKYILDSKFLKQAINQSEKTKGTVETDAEVSAPAKVAESKPEKAEAKPVTSTDLPPAAEKDLSLSLEIDWATSAPPEPILDISLELGTGQTDSEPSWESEPESSWEPEPEPPPAPAPLEPSLAELANQDFQVEMGGNIFQEDGEDPSEDNLFEEVDPSKYQLKAKPETKTPADSPQGPAKVARRVGKSGFRKEPMVFKNRSSEPTPTTDPSGSLDFSTFDDALDNIFSKTSTVAPEIRESHQKHWALFRTMPKDVFMDFVLALETRDYEAGSLIVRQGQEGSEMFLIAEGAVDVIWESGRKTTKIASLSEGDFFGEASLLTGEPRNATVRTSVPTNCLIFTRAHLHQLSKSHSSVMASIKSIYYTRLKQNASLAE